MSFTRRKFGSCVLLNTIRNLENLQYILPVDQHNYIHSVYNPPQTPTPRQAIKYLEQVYNAGESLKQRQGGHYVVKDFTELVLSQCIANYMQFIHKDEKI